MKMKTFGIFLLMILTRQFAYGQTGAVTPVNVNGTWSIPVTIQSPLSSWFQLATNSTASTTSIPVAVQAPLSSWFQLATNSTASTEITLASAASQSGLRWIVTGITCTNTSATTTSVALYDTTGQDAAASTRIECPQVGLGGQGGIMFGMGVPAFATATGKGLFAKPADAVTTIYITVHGYNVPY